jgi:hypothetical protein
MQLYSAFDLLSAGLIILAALLFLAVLHWIEDLLHWVEGKK